jgi:hypothetical protein
MVSLLVGIFTLPIIFTSSNCDILLLPTKYQPSPTKKFNFQQSTTSRTPTSSKRCIAILSMKWMVKNERTPYPISSARFPDKSINLSFTNTKYHTSNKDKQGQGQGLLKRNKVWSLTKEKPGLYSPLHYEDLYSSTNMTRT